MQRVRMSVNSFCDYNNKVPYKINEPRLNPRSVQTENIQQDINSKQRWRMRVIWLN